MSQRHRNQEDELKLERTREAARLRMSRWTLGPYSARQECSTRIGMTHPKYATLLHNVVSTSALEDVTPEKAWSGNNPRLHASHLRFPEHPRRAPQ